MEDNIKLKEDFNKVHDLRISDRGKYEKDFLFVKNLYTYSQASVSRIDPGFEKKYVEFLTIEDYVFNLKTIFDRIEK